MEDYETMNKNRSSAYQGRVKDVRARIHKIVEEPGIQPHYCVEADGWFVRGLAVFVDDLESIFKNPGTNVVSVWRCVAKSIEPPRLYVVHYRVKTLESAGILRTERIANERRCRVVRGFSVNERV